MTEIEIKARVTDRAALEKRLSSIADGPRKLVRDDEYWGASAESHRKIRLRHEIHFPAGAEKTEDWLVTYKRKEARISESGIMSEVTNEMETLVSDPEPLRAFLTDNGFTIKLRKHKDVMDWTKPVDIPGLEPLTACFELCTVPPLGDFLEIEILSLGDGPQEVQAVQAELDRLLEMAGIPREQIEPRYYSELLRLVQ